MPLTYTLRVSPSGASESQPYNWNYANQLAQAGAGYALTGTPVIEYVPNDGSLTIGTPIIDGTNTVVQAFVTGSVAAAKQGRYELVCRCNLTDGVTTLTDIQVNGYLDVEQTA